MVELSIEEKIKEYLDIVQISDEIKGGVRYYTVPNNRYPSVTSILSATSDDTWLEEWRNKIGHDKANEITNAAASRGSSLHNLIERHFDGHLNMEDDRQSKGWKLFRKLQIYLKDFKPLALEMPLWSDNLKIAGRCDFLGYYKDNLCVVDWKSSSKEKSADMVNDYFLQATIYAMMIYERLGIIVKQIVIVIASPEGFPQLFIRDVSEYIKECIMRINSYYKTDNNLVGDAK